MARNLGIWINPQELAALPTAGPAWDQIYKIANSDFGVAVGGHNDNHDTYTLAQALVAARLNDATLKKKVVANLLSAIGSDKNGNALSISRNLTSYVIAADVIDFVAFDPASEAKFRQWVYQMITIEHAAAGCGPSGCSIPGKQEDRPNNHGTMAGAARAAASIYLGDSTQLTRTAIVFKGYLGDRATYSKFYFGELSWQSDPTRPVGINPVGAVKNGNSVDGVLPDDQRRGGTYSWPPPHESYVYEGLQGAVVCATILNRFGFDVWNWENRALLRSYEWLYNVCKFPAGGDDIFQLPLVDYAYGTHYWNGSPVGNGKNMGWTSWTHATKMVAPTTILAPSNLRVTGIVSAPTASVSLSWTASSAAVGYRVYRDDHSGSGWVRVNSSNITGTVYTDSTVAAGKTYAYAVTAVASSGTESSKSAAVSASVPVSCSCTISPTSRSHTAAAGTGTITVSAPAGCNWAVSTPASWIVLGTTSGSGNATISYSVQANTTTSVRAASILISDRSFTVSQAAGTGTTPPPPTGSVTFVPQHDARVSSASVTTNYGSSDYLRLTSGVWNSYLKFSVTGLSGTVKKARLRLYVTDASDRGGSVYKVANTYLNSSTGWVESGLTWKNAPPMATLLASVGAANLSTWVEFDVTAAVKGNGEVSFGLTSNSTNSVFYRSSEGTQKPTLTIETY